VRHRFLRGETLVAEGEQIRIWGMAGPDGTSLTAVSVPAKAAALLRGDTATDGDSGAAK
jgi:hypothetical protein